MSEIGFTLGGRLTVAITGGSALTPALDPCEPGAPAARPDLSVHLGHVLDPLPVDADWAGDGGDGWLSTVHGGRLRLRHRDGGACDVGDLGRLPLELAADERLAPWRLVTEALVPALQAVGPLRGLAMPHATTAFDENGAVLLSGWSESGKTETALALHERGWSVLSDKWTTLDDEGRAWPFPVHAGVRRWVLDDLPGLRAQLPLAARARIAAAGPLAGLADRGARRARGRMGAALAGRASEALRQAERISVPVSTLRAGRPIPSDGVPVSLVVMLSTVLDGPPRVREIDRDRALRRAADSAEYERRALAAMTLRGRFGDGGTSATGAERAAAVTQTEADVLARALTGVDIIEIACPFPTDPRSIADLVLQAWR